jgi:hypothetical protein
MLAIAVTSAVAQPAMLAAFLLLARVGTVEMLAGNLAEIPRMSANATSSHPLILLRALP